MVEQLGAFKYAEVSAKDNLPENALETLVNELTKEIMNQNRHEYDTNYDASEDATFRMKNSVSIQGSKMKKKGKEEKESGCC